MLLYLQKSIWNIDVKWILQKQYFNYWNWYRYCKTNFKILILILNQIFDNCTGLPIPIKENPLTYKKHSDETAGPICKVGIPNRIVLTWTMSTCFPIFEFLPVFPGITGSGSLVGNKNWRPESKLVYILWSSVLP